ncbi:disulfide bond formation protein B [Aurantimonas aggregata]|uniref:Disulfide bond formation protein B n=1 Tax=Aurantimonas aggregata TaxID=2047720 RepID=A0A6L9MHS6_9HYPH|nr:disulfide bond formation protein B [Aurantimonas aggregata]NDV87389.1 disulfide bond formation protein B [Aurantimonas aggregata]
MSLFAQFQRPTGFRQTLSSGFLLVGLAATVGTALIFEHVGGYIPCALCLQQRIPYYVAIPVALIAFVAAAGRAPARFTRLLLLAIGAIMLVSLYLAVKHAGVEWGFWAGPADCAQVGGGELLGGDLLATIDAIRPPSCDEAAGRFLGLSFAGWNVLASALFAAVALRAAFARADRFA